MGTNAVRIALASIAAACAMLWLEPPIQAHATHTTLPFVRMGGKIYVKASVNGRIPTDFLIDTGADAVIITRATADRSAIGIVGAQGVLSSLELGGMTVEHVACRVRGSVLRFSPALGGEAFSPLTMGLSLEVDYGTGAVTIARELSDEPADIDLPMQMIRIPIVGILVDGVERQFIVDTASPITAIAPRLARILPGSARIRFAPVRLFDTWGHRDEQAAVVLPGPFVAIGRLRFAAYPLIVHDMSGVERALGFPVDGILGADFLAHYRVTFDLVRRLLRLHPVR